MAERLIDKIKAVADWERENPALAAAWNEALREKRERQRPQALAAFLATQEARTADFLRSCEFSERGTDTLLSGAARYTPAMRAVQAFIEQLGRPRAKTYLVLAGDPGLFKTTAAGQVFLALGKTSYHDAELGPVWQWRDRSCMYCDARAEARASIYSDDEKRREGRLKACRALVVDELGAETFTDPWLSRFEELIDARYKVQLPTVLITNLSQANFSRQYGARVWRRVHEEGMWPRLVETVQEERRAG